MSPTHPPDCPELPATLLWIHGEGDEAALHHAAGCSVCTAAIADAEQVFAALPPRGVVRHERSAQVIALPTPAARPALAEPDPARPAWRPIAGVVGGVLAAAAALLLVVRLVMPAGPAPAPVSDVATGPAPVAAEPTLAPSPPDAQVAARAVDAPAAMDDAFDSLSEDLDALEASLASL